MKPQAILLAAGAGRRFWPFNRVRSKCAFPLLNEPLVARLSRQLRELGVDRQIVVTAPGDRSVRAALAAAGASPLYREQRAQAGSADAVLEALGGTESEAPLLLISSDVATDTGTLRRLIDAAQQSDISAAAIAGEPCDRPLLGAEVANGAIRAIEGGCRRKLHPLVGLYMLQPRCLPYLLEGGQMAAPVPVGGMPPAEAEIAGCLAAAIARGEQAAAISPGRFAVDLDRPWQILEATRLASLDFWESLPAGCIHPEARVHESAQIEGRLVLEAGASIGRGVLVRGDLCLQQGAQLSDGAIAGPGCRLGPNARATEYALLSDFTVLGRGVLCAHSSEMSGVALEGACLYHYCEISGVVGQSVDIGAATVCGGLRFDDQAAVRTRHGYRHAPPAGANACYLGDFSRTGVNSMLMPGVHVGAYSCVGPGVLLNRDLEDETLITLRQDLEERPWGPRRYGW